MIHSHFLHPPPQQGKKKDSVTIISNHVSVYNKIKKTLLCSVCGFARYA